MVEKYIQIPGPDGTPTKGQLIDFKIGREDWSIYQLEDGTTLRVKLTVVQIAKALDEETGETLYLPTNEPLYHVRHEVRVIADIPDFLVKKND